MTERIADVDIRGVGKSFGGRPVLHDITLGVAAGTITAVLGPSGCGKTTLLRILAGFEGPDAGVVRIGGHAVADGEGLDVPAHRRRVGLMPQEGALFPHLDVAGNIAFGLRRRRSAASGRVVRRWLSVVGLDGLARARPAELSGGQQQRVALARALAAEPSVVLLDEPFAALDTALRTRVREDIAAILREAGTTALLVTHDQAEALSLADSVALLMDGTIAAHQPPAELYQQPATLAAARFVGSTVELSGRAHGGRVDTVLGRHPSRLPVRDGTVIVAVRPEQVGIGGPGEPGVPAAVIARHFYGAESAVELVLGEGTPMVARTGRPDGPVPGDRVSVTIAGPVLAYPSPSGG